MSLSSQNSSAKFAFADEPMVIPSSNV